MSPFDQWVRDLEARHLAELRFAEVSRALRALSATYVERRGKIQEGAALSGAGKRAAFALFYAPLHYLTLRTVVERLGAAPGARTLVDLGCGTGASAVAWAEQSAAIRSVLAIDRSSWALAEAIRTCRHFAVSVRTSQGDATAAPWPAEAAFLAGFTINELSDAARDRLLTRLLDRAGRGNAILIVEPLARAVAPWWSAWQSAFAPVGGQGDEWRFRTKLPDIVAKLDRAAGLDHRELTARSLWIAPKSGYRRTRP